jgi:hypothetical protein
MNIKNNLDYFKVKYKKPTKKEIEFLINKVKLEKAALLLGVSTTNLKKTCRQYGFKKWKYRETLSKNKKTNSETQEIKFELECPFEELKKETEKKR